MAFAKGGQGRSGKLPKNVCGERVRIALVEARPAGLSLKQLVAATGLSPYQVRKGILWIKETAATEHLTPLIWTPRDGYRFPTDPADWIAYERAQFKASLTRVGRLLSGTIAPHALRYPDDRWAKFVLAQTTSMASTLDMLANGTTPVGSRPAAPTT
ncbi:hypothetical protein [Actinomadura sp. 6N118]|uniref:hypothetical protein n=1 Tax=Actinomadura sp. 6N118 TaxID=3375151 RepID=UPI0037941CD4